MLMANTYSGPWWNSPLVSLNAQNAGATPCLSKYATALSSRALASSAPGFSAARQEKLAASMKTAAALDSTAWGFMGVLYGLEARPPSTQVCHECREPLQHAE